LLDGLSRHLTPTPSTAQQQAILAGELASAKAEMAAAQSERERATSHLEESARTLQDRITDRERREIRLRDLRAADLIALLKDDKELDNQINAALKQVGAPAALESIGELNKVVEESYSTAGRATAFLVSLLTGRNVAIVFAGIAVFFIAPPLITH
jgi:outer membrane PBP1 activator LpoA protein